MNLHLTTSSLRRRLGAAFAAAALLVGATAFAAAPANAADQLTSPTPCVTGLPIVNATLAAIPGDWGPDPVEVSYQWFRGDEPVATATGPTYQLTTADLGEQIHLAVTGEKDGFADATRSSAQTRPVAAAAPMVIGWGLDDQGQSDPPGGLSEVASVAAGESFAFALRADGTLVGWGRSDRVDLSPGLSGIIAVSAGGTQELALTSDGRVLQLPGGEPIAGVTEAAAISAGFEHSLVLRRDGTVVALGSYVQGPATPPAGLSGVIAVSAGWSQSLALKSDGTVVQWGLSDERADLTPPAGLSAVVAVASGRDFNLALKADGTVVAWGDNSSGQTKVPAGLKNVVAIAAGNRHAVAVTSGGTVVAWGDHRYAQTTVPPRLGQVRFASAGAYNTLVMGTIVKSFTAAPKPKISDKTPRVDQVLTVDPGIWSPAPVGFTYQWYKGSVRISGATGSSYTVRPTDLRSKLKVAVTGTKDGYTAVTRLSSTTAKVAPARLSPTPVPVIDNPAPRTDQVLTADPGEWGPSPVALSYRWYRDNRRIKGAVSPTYTVQPTDVGHRLRVRVTGTKPGYTTKTVASARTLRVAKATMSIVIAPMIGYEGTIPRVGKQLFERVGLFDPPAARKTFQWLRDGKAIRRATGSWYILQAADVGHIISLKVTASRPGYLDVVQRSTLNTPVEPGLVGFTPRLSDTTPVVGQELGIVMPEWQVPDGGTVGYRYQWFSGSLAIDFANGPSYTVQSSDAGTRIWVKVTGLAADYAELTIASAKSARVVNA